MVCAGGQHRHDVRHLRPAGREAEEFRRITMKVLTTTIPMAKKHYAAISEDSAVFILTPPRTYLFGKKLLP